MKRDLSAAVLWAVASLALGTTQTSGEELLATDTEALRRATPREPVVLRLGGGLEVRGTVQHASISVLGSRILRGRIEAGGGTFVLAVHEQAVAGTVVTTAGTLAVLPAGHGYTKIVAAGHERLQDDAVVVETLPVPKRRSAWSYQPARARAGGAAAVVDIVALFTKAARQAVGSKAAMIAALDLQIANANLALQNSLVRGQFRLVAARPISGYSEPADLQDVNRDHIRGGTRLNTLSQRFSRRYGAEIATVVANTTTGECGWAVIPAQGALSDPRTPSQTQALPGWAVHNSLAARCLGDGFLLAHELGHNLGNCHQHDVTSNVCEFPYSYGFDWYPFAAHLGTVMAVGAGTVPYYSNPKLKYDGVRLGVRRNRPDPSDVTRSMNKVFPILSEAVRCKVKCG